MISDAEDLESSSSQHGSRLSDDIDETADNAIDDPFPVQTIKIAISTPVDFQNVYFEIATIKSPYTFQVIHCLSIIMHHSCKIGKLLMGLFLLSQLALNYALSFKNI